MAGLIDSKTRIIDAQLTLRGKRSLSSGGISVKYISFSDIGAKYESDGTGVAVEPLQLGFEAFNTSNDEITVTTDDFGSLNGFDGDGFSVRPDGSASPSLSSTAVSDLIFSGSLESFDNQRLISTRDALFNDPGFSVSPNEISYSVTDTFPFKDEPSVTSIDDVESLFADKRLSRSIRFQYLPPIQRTITTVGNEIPFGSYANVREDNIKEEELETIINSLESHTLTTSRYTDKNEMCMQLFESSSSGFAKLDIIEFGNLQLRKESGKQRKLYFIGKIYDDGFGNPTFVNMFDLVIE